MALRVFHRGGIYGGETVSTEERQYLRRRDSIYGGETVSTEERQYLRRRDSIYGGEAVSTGELHLKFKDAANLR
jgi:hypothetical protein